MSTLMKRMCAGRALRSMSTIAKIRLEPKPSRGAALREAENVVGYSTSFLNLRWILNDEMANIASYIRRLIGTNHPLLETAKSLLVRNDVPNWGLVVLLLSKTAGFGSAAIPDLERDKTANILHSQRVLAEVTEMIKTSQLIHSGIMVVDQRSDAAADLNFGNKLALLTGDHLLGASFQEIARLRNNKVQEIITSTLRDLAESHFIGPRTAANDPVPSRPLAAQRPVDVPLQLGYGPFDARAVLGHMRSEWTLRNVLAGGSLLGKCCQAAMVLAAREQYNELAHDFGRSLALAWQAAAERKRFGEDGRISLISAPVMLHLAEEPRLWFEMEAGLSGGEINYELIKKQVVDGVGIDKCRELEAELIQRALKCLLQFPESASRNALVNIVNAI